MSLPLSSPSPLSPPSLVEEETPHNAFSLTLVDGLLPATGLAPPSLDVGWGEHSVPWESLDHSPIAMALVDAHGRILRANHALGRLLLCDAANLTDTYLAELALPDEPLADPSCFQGIASGRSPSVRTECRLSRNDATVAATRVSLSVPTEPWREPLILAVFEDLSEHVELERQLQRSQKTEALGRLAGGITHDFSNMLAVIVGYSQMLLDEFPLDDSQRQRMEIIHSAGRRAEGLTRQLLEFNRRQGTAPRPIDLNELLKRMLPWLRCLVGEDVELALALDPKLGAVRADPAQIEQVLLNLLVNAREALPRGGTVRVETRSMECGTSASDEEGGVVREEMVALSVSDNGCGMDAATRARIFDPFFTTKAEGSGLGLSTVASIVAQASARILVQSEPGHGTSFTICLPRSALPASGAAPVKAEGSLGGSETILLVEDERMVRNYVRDVLELHGYTVLTAAGSREALGLCRIHEGPIHLLLTDVVMPEISGRELSERVALVRPETRVLFMSGYTDDAVVRHGVQNAGTAFLQKPFAPDVLTQKVRDLLGCD